MTKTKRPRVAAIGLDGSQVESIEPLCGDLRSAHSVSEYLKNYSWTETDVVVSSAIDGEEVDSRVNLMAIEPSILLWSDSHQSGFGLRAHHVMTDTKNTERELTVPPACPDLYKPQVSELSRQLGQVAEPPSVIATSREDQSTLIETTSGRPVALRLVLPSRSRGADGEPPRPIAIILPGSCNLVAWFRAFLYEVHESDSSAVPQAPPRLDHPSDWYTPEEKSLADRRSHIESEIERLSSQRDQLQTELAAGRRRESRQWDSTSPLGRHRVAGRRAQT